MLEKTSQVLQNRGTKIQDTHGKNFQDKLANFGSDLGEDIKEYSKQGAAVGVIAMGITAFTWSLFSENIGYSTSLDSVG